MRGSGREVVFFGTDAGDEQVRDVKVRQDFARSMSLADAMSRESILAYEMNGTHLPQPNGFPLRLIAPGWYGIANVKWLDRIEVRDTPFMGRFMARDYVTLREEQHEGKWLGIETSVGRELLKSVPAKVTRRVINTALSVQLRARRSLRWTSRSMAARGFRPLSTAARRATMPGESGSSTGSGPHRVSIWSRHARWISAGMSNRRWLIL